MGAEAWREGACCTWELQTVVFNFFKLLCGPAVCVPFSGGESRESKSKPAREGTISRGLGWSQPQLPSNSGTVTPGGCCVYVKVREKSLWAWMAGRERRPLGLVALLAVNSLRLLGRKTPESLR